MNEKKRYIKRVKKNRRGGGGKDRRKDSESKGERE